MYLIYKTEMDTIQDLKTLMSVVRPESMMVIAPIGWSWSNTNPSREKKNMQILLKIGSITGFILQKL